MLMNNPSTQRHVFSVLVSDEPGILARVVGLFSGRGYNIESLSVANVNAEQSISRITVVSTGTLMVLDQIEAQLNRLIPVRQVTNLTLAGSLLEKELALVKLICSGDKRLEALKVAESLKVHAADATSDSFIFEVIGTPEENDRFIALMRSLGKTEISRSGVIGLSRGNKIL